MRQWLRRLRTTILLSCLLAFGIPLAAGAAPPAAALVNSLRGQVQVQRGGVGPFRPLRLGDALYPGDIVQTGAASGVNLGFSAGPSVNLDANTTNRIPPRAPARQAPTLIQAIFGVLRAHLFPGQSIPSVSSNITARGTDVLIAVAADGTTTLTVITGEADITNTTGAERRTQTVLEGQQSTVRPGQTPTPPVAVDVSGLIAWTADVVTLPLEFEWPSAATRPDYPVDAARFAAATQRAPADAAAWVGLGQALRGLGDATGALAAFNHVSNNEEALVGKALVLLSQNKPDEARTALEPVRDQATPRAVLGLINLHEGKSADAETDLQAALAQAPTLYPAQSLLALAFLNRNDLPDADKSARAAVRLRPDSAQTQGTLAMVLFFEGKTGDAEAASRTALRANPQSPFALLAEGRARMARQQTDAARAAFETAVGVAPNLGIVHQELGAVYLRLGNPRKSEEEYRIALKTNPQSADALTGLGTALNQQGRYTDAETALRQATAIAPTNATAHYNLATFFIERGRLDEARQELESGVQSAPDRGILYARLAEVDLYQQNLFAAQGDARRAVSLLPSSAQAHYELGRVYLEEERTVQAEQEFRQATTLDRQFAAARFALGLTEEQEQSGRDLTRPLGNIAAASQSGAAGQLNILNIETLGAQERLQAAIQDPLVIRIASRSFGDAQVDGRLGDQGTRDFDLSFLREHSDRRGEAGLTAQHFHDAGVRANADTSEERFGVLSGGTEIDNPSGYFLQAQTRRMSSGGDVSPLSNPNAATQRYVKKIPDVLLGFNLERRENSRTRFLLQTDQPDQRLSSSAGGFHRHGTSYHAEVRHDALLSGRTLLSGGFAAGSRQFITDTIAFPQPDPVAPFPGSQIHQEITLHTLEAYLRGETAVSPKLTLTAEMRLEQIEERDSDDVSIPGFPASPPSTTTVMRTTSGQPTLVLTYQPDARNGLRLRARSIFSTVTDFQLLDPQDVFLISFDNLPSAAAGARSESFEMEYDHTFSNASFLRLGVFQQDVWNAGDAQDEHFSHVRFRSAQLRYEGILSPTTTFFLDGNANTSQGARDFGSGYGVGPRESLSLIPRFGVEAGVQYLSRAGWFVQPAYAYQGASYDAALSPGPRARLGGFGLVNARFGKRWGLKSTVFVEVANVFNKGYVVPGDITFERLEPGRQIRVGVSLRF